MLFDIRERREFNIKDFKQYPDGVQYYTRYCDYVLIVEQLILSFLNTKAYKISKTFGEFCTNTRFNDYGANSISDRLEEYREETVFTLDDTLEGGLTSKEGKEIRKTIVYQLLVNTPADTVKKIVEEYQQFEAEEALLEAVDSSSGSDEPKDHTMDTGM